MNIPDAARKAANRSLFQLLLLLLGVSAAVAAPTAKNAALPGERKVWRVVSPLFINREVKSLAVGLLNESGRAVYGYGKTEGKRSKAPKGDTVFEIGSITKTFTGLLLAMAQMEGKLDLTDPVAPFLPPEALGPNSPFKRIAFLDLAAHSSGLPERPDNLPSKDRLNPFAGYTPELLLDYLKRCAPKRPPGQSFEYSNLGAGLAGFLLERLYGKSYEELVREKICEPLGLYDTRIEMTRDMRARYAPGHDLSLSPLPAWDVPVLQAAGALRSTADDLLSYAAANLGLTDSPLYAAMLLSHVPRYHAPQTPEMFLGLFWNVYNFKGHRYLLHAGRSGGYFALLLLDPNRKAAVVLLANSEKELMSCGWNLLELLTKGQ